jgi:hypothetical protein
MWLFLESCSPHFHNISIAAPAFSDDDDDDDDDDADICTIIKQLQPI